MNATAACDDEALRLAALRGLAILDTPPDPRFDRIVRLARLASQAPIALVSLVDDHRQWFKAVEGLDEVQTPRSDAFCAHALGSAETLWVEDARADPRFADNRLVLGEPHIRFYAGAPIRLSSGFVVGTVCVIDTVPRPYDATLDAMLATLASLAADEMESLASRATIDAFVDNAPTSLVMTDLNLRILRVSQTWSGLYRRSAASVTGLTLGQAIPELSSEWDAMFARVLDGAIERGVSAFPASPSGPERWFKWSAAPWRDAAGRICGLLIASQDVSALEQARVAAERASQAKSDFLANMSHEIRTPLNGVLGVVSALARTPMSPEQTAMVSLIERSGLALNSLLSDMLDVSRLEAGQLSIIPAPIDLGAMLADLEGLFVPLATDKGVALEIDHPPLSTWTVGDPVRLRQILSNLLSNALKFTQVGRVVLRAQGPDADGVWRFEVEDTGIGFAPEEAESLFDRFHQADASATRRFGGAGLGLAISRSLARLMGGSLTATGQPGQGACFTLSLTLPSGGAPHADEDDAQEVPALRILLAEDNPINQQVVKLILDQVGADLVVVENGREAVETFTASRFDLVLMDMQMPVMDGLSAVRAIRAFETEHARPRTPIKTLSANALDEHRQAALAAGADDHVPKPITASGLIAALMNLPSP